MGGKRILEERGMHFGVQRQLRACAKLPVLGWPILGRGIDRLEAVPIGWLSSLKYCSG
jgi:hypothetical protein